jgi:hypothetical protein
LFFFCFAVVAWNCQLEPYLIEQLVVFLHDQELDFPQFGGELLRWTNAGFQEEQLLQASLG